MMTFLLLGLATAGLGAMFLSLYRDPDARNRRALRRAASISIGEFRDGDFGKVVGRVESKDATLQAPLSGRRCVYYFLSIQKKQQSEDGHGFFWHEIYADESAQNFVISDRSDTALVLLAGARVRLGDVKSFVAGTLGEFPEHVRHALLALPEVAGVAAMGHTLRFAERILEPGARVAVMGYGVYQPNPDPAAATGHYRAVAQQLVMQGRPGQPLLVSNEPTIIAS